MGSRLDISAMRIVPSAVNQVILSDSIIVSMARKFITTPERSRVMASIRSQETKCEVMLRKCLWKNGTRGYRKYPKLPGKPDILFPKLKLVIFIDGCFWHKCPLHYRPPKSNIEYWSAKVERNIKRDFEVDELLKNDGYIILRIWEHEILTDLDITVAKIKTLINSIKLTP
jgi:DNA mismatch endonuclease (patch repair protein)